MGWADMPKGPTACGRALRSCGRSDRLVAHAAVENDDDRRHDGAEDQRDPRDARVVGVAELAHDERHEDVGDDADEDRHDERDVLLAGEDQTAECTDDGTDDDGPDDCSDHVTLLLAATGATAWSARGADNTCDEINVPSRGAGVVDVAPANSTGIRPRGDEGDEGPGSGARPKASARLAVAGDHAVADDERGCDDDADEAGDPVDPLGVVDTGGLVVDERADQGADGTEDDGEQDTHVLLPGEHQPGERSHDRTRDEGGKDGSDHVYASSFEPVGRAATTRRSRLVPPPCTRMVAPGHTPTEDVSGRRLGGHDEGRRPWWPAAFVMPGRPVLGRWSSGGSRRSPWPVTGMSAGSCSSDAFNERRSRPPTCARHPSSRSRSRRTGP